MMSYDTVFQEQDQTEMKKKSDALDAELAPIHGSTAFKDFIDKKSGRRPEVCFLSLQILLR